MRGLRLPSVRVNRVLAILLFGSTFAAMGLILYRDRERILAFDWRIDIGYLALTTLLYSITLGLLFIAWCAILGQTSGFRDTRKNFRIYYLALLARRLPSALWYITGRLVMYGRVGVAESAVLGSTALESLVLALAGALVFLALLPFYGSTDLSVRALPMAVAGGILLAVLSQPQYVLRLINRLFAWLKRAPMNVGVRRRDVLRWLLAYSFAWLIGGAGLFCMINAIYVLPLSDLPAIVGIATLTTLVSLLTSLFPGGSSLKELTLAVLLSNYVPLSAGVVIAIAYRIWQTLLDFCWAGLALWMGDANESPHA
jgi:hypothetical protein